MSSVCLDNNILIWGIRGISTPGQEGMISRTQALFEDLDASDAHIMVPAVVVSEFLTGVPKAQHQSLLEVLNRRFELPPFDILYTHDGPLRTIADGLIEVRDLPPPRPRQSDLPGIV